MNESFFIYIRRYNINIKRNFMTLVNNDTCSFSFKFGKNSIASVNKCHMFVEITIRSLFSF